MDDATFLQRAMAEAEQHYASGRWPLALKRYQDTVFRRLTEVTGRGSRWWAADAIAIERLADLAILDGSLSAARDLLTGLHDLYLREHNHFAADYVAVKLSHLALESDDVVTAHAILKEMTGVIGDLESMDLSADGLQSWEASLTWPDQDEDATHALVTRLYFVMGGILASYGQFRDAIQCLERGESLASSSQVPSVSQVCVHLRVSLAAACLASGKLASCRDWLARAKATQPLPIPALQVRTRELQGKLSLMEGRYGEALDALYNLLIQSEKLGFERPIAAAGLNNAHLLILLNQTQKALEYIEHAESAAPDDHSLLVRARVLRELAYTRRESLADQVAITPSVSELWKGSAPLGSHIDNHRAETTDPLELPVPTDYLTFFEDRALAVQWRLNRGDFTAASELMDVVCSTFRACDSPLIHARVKALEGMVDYYRGKDAEAAGFLFEAVAELQLLGLAPEAWQTKRVLSWCLSRLGRPPQEIARLDAEIQKDLERLALSMPMADRSSYLLNKWTATEEYLLGEIDALVAMTRKAQSQPWWRRSFTRFDAMKKLNGLLDRINRHKLESGSRFLGIETDETTVAEKKASALWRRLLFHPIRAATITFLVLPDRALIIQQSWLHMGFGVSAITRGDLRDLVAGWYQTAGKFGSVRDLGVDSITRTDQEVEHRREQTLDRLGKALQIQALFSSLPKHIKSLRIAPDDSLLGFPFAVLRYRGKALPETFAVSMLFPHANSKVVPNRRGKRALLVGVSRGSDGIAPLPNVELEIDAVQNWSLGRGYQVERLMDTAADKRRIIEALKKANLLHIACHGVFRTDKPGETGFVLIPDTGPSQILSLSELACLDLSALEHATLSSCWAADRFILPGRQTIGLPETLLRCGTRSVLSCLWPLDDYVASCFNDQFYKYLDHYPRDEALRRTQQDCIHGRLPLTHGGELNMRSPIYWAGFNLYGSNAAL